MQPTLFSLDTALGKIVFPSYFSLLTLRAQLFQLAT